jgi:hypothetical protein
LPDFLDNPGEHDVVPSSESGVVLQRFFLDVVIGGCGDLSSGWPESNKVHGPSRSVSGPRCWGIEAIGSGPHRSILPSAHLLVKRILMQTPRNPSATSATCWYFVYNETGDRVYWVLQSTATNVKAESNRAHNSHLRCPKPIGHFAPAVFDCGVYRLANLGIHVHLIDPQSLVNSNPQLRS